MNDPKVEAFSLTAIAAFVKQMDYLVEREKNGSEINEAVVELSLWYNVSRSLFHWGTGFQPTDDIKSSEITSAIYKTMEALKFSTNLNNESTTNQTDRITLGWL